MYTNLDLIFDIYIYIYILFLNVEWSKNFIVHVFVPQRQILTFILGFLNISFIFSLLAAKTFWLTWDSCVFWDWVFRLVENGLGTNRRGPKYWYSIKDIVPKWSPPTPPKKKNNNNYGALMEQLESSRSASAI